MKYYIIGAVLGLVVCWFILGALVALGPRM